MTNTLTHLLIATLVGGSTVAGLEVIAPSTMSAPVSSPSRLQTDTANSGESVVLVFPVANRFGTTAAGLKPSAPSDRAPHPVAVLRVKSDGAESSSRSGPGPVDQFTAGR
jgi:hypothetical protein